MAVETKRASGRREVRYDSYQEFLADAEHLASVETVTVGNWTQAQIYEHLTRTMNASIDGFDKLMPAPVRWIMSLLMKKRFLTRPLPAGFKSTDKFIADPGMKTEDALISLREAIQRQQRETDRVAHPAFGRIRLDEWNQFHLRHAELHMSFLKEAEVASLASQARSASE